MTFKNVLRSLQDKGKATFAFNLQNFYQLEAAANTAQALRLPVIIQFSERFLRFLHEKYGLPYLVKRFRNQFVYFHLDHCTDLEFIKFCADSGFDSVMYDGSAFDIDVNIANSKLIIDYAGGRQCLVEGELGKVSGVEDGFGDGGSSYAEINEILRYVKETNIDLMALGIGNAHGFYENLEGLDLDILMQAHSKLGNDQLFVLHGGTGLPEEIIRQAIGYGVVKINLSTEIKKKTMDLIKDFSSENDLYNEISYHRTLVDGLSGLFEYYLVKYTR
jgi:ketose-bisphosphate aldolase